MSEDAKSATPNLDLLTDPNPTGYRRCRLKEGAQPHYVRRGRVVAGDEFVTEARHARELVETGAADVLGVAAGPDLSPVEAALAQTDDQPASAAKVDAAAQ